MSFVPLNINGIEAKKNGFKMGNGYVKAIGIQV